MLAGRIVAPTFFAVYIRTLPYRTPPADRFIILRVKSISRLWMNQPAYSNKIIVDQPRPKEQFARGFQMKHDKYQFLRLSVKKFGMEPKRGEYLHFIFRQF